MPEASGGIDGDDFSQAVAQVAVAAGRDDTLPILTGVRVEIDGDKITLLATDRYRLALRELTWTPERPDAAGVALVPARTLVRDGQVRSARRPASSSRSVARVRATELIGFEAGQRRTTSRLLDGDYPPVSRDLPRSSSDTDAVVDTATLIEAVKRVALVAEREHPGPAAFTDGQVVLEAGQGDDAQASEAIEASLSGEEIEIAFNPQFLLDGLGALGTPYVRLSFTQPQQAGRCCRGQTEPDGAADDSYRYLLMPVRLAG